MVRSIFPRAHAPFIQPRQWSVCFSAAGLKHELLLFLGQQRKLRRHHLELLIDESTTTVDFSPAVHAPPLKDALLELIGVRCQVHLSFVNPVRSIRFE